MDAIITSAKFAAYVWFTETPAGNGASSEEAARFVSAHWERFLGHADKGLGRLLLKVARPRRTREARRPRRAAAC